MDKSKKEPPGYWQHRPGFNYYLGYPDGKVYIISPSPRIKEVSLDRNVKDGKNLNK